MRSRTRRPVTANLLIALLAAAPARADVAGQQVVSGQATFDQSGNVTTIHASDGAIIDYSRFNVWSNEELHFVQPTNESRVLNRVLGDPTHIDGGLYANGIVYIVNPSGIYFGPKPIVQVGGLYAAAGDISNKDFLDRIDRFTLSGTVENAGSIESPAVALLGTAVRNSGIIRAPAGTIALVAGEKVLLTQLGSHVAVQVDGAAGGDGGFAEISGAQFLAADGRVDLGAAVGQTGTLLYDPKDIALHAGAPTPPATDDSDGSGSSLTGSALGSVLFGDVAALAEPFDIYQSELEGTNANIVLQAANSISSSDTFGVRIMDGNSLTMQTRNNTGDGTALSPGIHLSDVSFQTGGAGSITIATGDDGTGGGGTDTTASPSIEVGDLTTAGAAVNVTTKDGAITVGDVTTTGAGGAVNGSPGGAIKLLAGDANHGGDSDVQAGDLTSSGGNGGAGTGGVGGPIEVRSTGVLTTPFANGRPLQVVEGGGDIEVGNVTALGGHGTTTGGHGGNLRIETTDGAIEAGNLTSSGGAGDVNGGAAGTLIVRTTNGNGDATPNPIQLGDLRAVGGAGDTGAGGAGALVDVRTLPSTRIVELVEQGHPEHVLREATGGGSVTIASIDTSGGGGATGGSAGTENIFSRPAPAARWASARSPRAAATVRRATAARARTWTSRPRTGT